MTWNALIIFLIEWWHRLFIMESMSNIETFRNLEPPELIQIKVCSWKKWLNVKIGETKSQPPARLASGYLANLVSSCVVCRGKSKKEQIPASSRERERERERATAHGRPRPYNIYIYIYLLIYWAHWPPGPPEGWLTREDVVCGGVAKTRSRKVWIFHDSRDAFWLRFGSIFH